jgi:hypothetical protein
MRLKRLQLQGFDGSPQAVEEPVVNLNFTSVMDRD